MWFKCYNTNQRSFAYKTNQATLQIAGLPTSFKICLTLNNFNISNILLFFPNKLCARRRSIFYENREGPDIPYSKFPYSKFPNLKFSDFKVSKFKLFRTQKFPNSNIFEFKIFRILNFLKLYSFIIQTKIRDYIWKHSSWKAAFSLIFAVYPWINQKQSPWFGEYTLFLSEPFL